MTGRTVKASILYLIPSVLNNALPLLSLPLLTRTLSSEDFGLIALGQVYGTVAFGLANLGVSSAFERNWFQYRNDPTKLSSLYLSVLIYLLASGALVLAGSAIAAPWIDHLLFQKLSPPHLIVLAATSALLRGINQIGYGFLRNDERPREFASINIAEGVGAFALTLLFVVGLGYGTNGFFAAQVVAFGASTLFISWQVLKRAPGRFSGPLLSEALRLGSPLTFRVLLSLLANQFDKYMLSLLSPMGQVGLYGIGQRMAQVPYIFTTALDGVFIPRVYRMMFDAREAVTAKPDEASQSSVGKQKAEEIGRFLIPFHYVSVGIALLVCLFAEETLTLLTAPSFHSAADIVIILSVYYATLFFGKINGRQILFASRTLLSSGLLAISVALNVAFYIPLIRWAGAQGAAAATLFAGVLSGYISLAFAQKCFRIDWQVRSLINIYSVLFAAAGTLVLMRYLHCPYAMRAAMKLATLLVFGAVGARMGILDRNTLRVILGQLRRKKDIRGENSNNGENRLTSVGR